MKKYSNYKFKDFISDETFYNYVKRLNTADIDSWEEWMKQNPENKKIAEEVKETIQLLNFKKDKLSLNYINNECSNLSKRINVSKPTLSLKQKTRYTIKMWQSIAAVFFFLCLICLLLSRKTCFNQENKTAYNEIIVPKGEIKKITLPDSSTIVLNSDSKLKYNDNFGKKKRDVFLEGEAYFDVSHNSDKPFIVHTCENTVKVIGTAFNISAFPGDNVHRISLERGKIKFAENGGKFSSLSPNQIYLLIRENRQSKIFKSQDIKMYSSWKEGSIRFVNQTFSDITTKLERSHNIIFKIENKKIKNYRYTGEFSRKKNIENILKIIKLTTPFNYEIKNDTIIIK